MRTLALVVGRRNLSAPTILVERELLYARHFALLAGFSVLAAVLAKFGLPSSVTADFACYGAFHATALAAAARSPISIGRSCLFIAASAGLCVLTLRAGVFIRLQAAHAGGLGMYLPPGPYLPLGLSAAVGAIGYGLAAQRILGLNTASPRALGAISFGCLMATLGAALILAKLRLFGPWGVAVAWWFAFSGGWWIMSRPSIARE